MIKQKIKENDLVYKPKHESSMTTLYPVQKHDKSDKPGYPFVVTTSYSNYYFNEDGISSEGERIVFLATPENKKYLEDLFLIEFESYKNSAPYQEIKTIFSDLIDRTEKFSETFFDEELPASLQDLYVTYFGES